MSKYQFGSIVDRKFRLELQRMADYISGMGYTYEESLQKAQDILEEARQTNDMNESVQDQINTLIAESGTSDAEVLQARTDATGKTYNVLKERLDQSEEKVNSQMTQNMRRIGHYESNALKKGDFESNSFRIPAGVRLNDGSIIVFSQVQYAGTSDYTNQDIGMSKSTDGGFTWSDKKIVVSAINSDSRVMNPTIIYDEDNDKIILFVTEVFNTDSSVVWWRTPDEMWDTYVCISDDGGDTWSKSSIKDDLLNSRKEHWTMAMPGLGTGVKMADGTYVVAMEVGYDDGTNNRIQNTLMYSTDLINWTLSNPTPELGDEANIVMLDDRTILLNARNFRTQSPEMRKIFYTRDLGATWHEHATHKTIPESRATMGHMLSIDIEGEKYIIFSHMQSEDGTRKQLGVSVLSHDLRRWSKVEVVKEDEFHGYSFLVHNKNYPNELYIISEEFNGRIKLTNISYMLPTIKAIVRSTQNNTTQPFMHSDRRNDKMVDVVSEYLNLEYENTQNDSSHGAFDVNGDGSIQINQAGMYLFSGLVGYYNVIDPPFIFQVDLHSNGRFSRRIVYGTFDSSSGYAPLNYAGYFREGTLLEIKFLANKEGALRGVGGRYNHLTIVKLF